MNQQALATVILRIVGLTYFYAAITAFVSGGVFSQVVNFNQISEGEDISMVAVLSSMMGIQSIFGLALMIFAKPISKVLFKENEKVNEEKTLTATTLIQAAVPIVGLYFLLPISRDSLRPRSSGIKSRQDHRPECPLSMVWRWRTRLS